MALPWNGRRRGGRWLTTLTRTGGSSTGECRGTGTVEVTDTSLAGDANTVIGTAGSFFQPRGVVEYAATRTG